jgi:hypothetical protein
MLGKPGNKLEPPAPRPERFPAPKPAAGPFAGEEARDELVGNMGQETDRWRYGFE